MARTKQTARSSVSNKLPKKHLYISHRVARKTAPLSGKTAQTIPLTGHKGMKKIHHFKPGTLAIKEIRKYQRNVRVIEEGISALHHLGFGLFRPSCLFENSHS